jgi:hypothetical protein
MSPSSILYHRRYPCELPEVADMGMHIALGSPVCICSRKGIEIGWGVSASRQAQKHSSFAEASVPAGTKGSGLEQLLADALPTATFDHALQKKRTQSTYTDAVLIDRIATPIDFFAYGEDRIREGKNRSFIFPMPPEADQGRERRGARAQNREKRLFLGALVHANTS